MERKERMKPKALNTTARRGGRCSPLAPRPSSLFHSALRIPHSAFLPLVLLAATIAGAGPAPERLKALQGVNEAKLREVIETVSEGESRVAGYPRNLELAEWVATRFRQIGLRNVDSMPFTVATPVQKFAQLEVEGEAEPVPLHAVWPNLVRTSTLERTTGELHYAADGHLHRLNGQDVRGDVVLLDFNSRGRWENAAMLGAAACVLIGTDDLAAGELRNKYYDVPLTMPRFWVDEAIGTRLRDRALAEQAKPAADRKPIRVTVHARVDWEQLLTRNVYGFVDGTDPDLRRELIVVESYTDSISVIPSLAPGAQQACGLAAMLAMAEHFAAHPPKRSMMFVASSGHAQGIAGVRHFFDAYDRKLADLNNDLAAAKQEVGRLVKLREALTPVDPLEARLDTIRRIGLSFGTLDLLHELWLHSLFADTLFAPAFPAPPTPDGTAPRWYFERATAVAAEAVRLSKIVEARKASQDPTAVFGESVAKSTRDTGLMLAALACIVALGIAVVVLRGDELDGRERIVLGVLAIAFVALAVVAPGLSAMVRPAAIGAAVALLVTMALVGGERRQGLAREAVTTVGLLALIVVAHAAGAHWFLVVLLVMVPGLLWAAPWLKGRGEGLLLGRNVTFFLALGLAGVLQATHWSASWALPPAALPGVGIALVVVLLLRDLSRAAARKAVMSLALVFGLLFLVGFSPHKEKVETDVLRDQMIERLRDPMRLRAEAYAKQLYRLRTANSEDHDELARLDDLRIRYKRLSWRDGYGQLTDAEAPLFEGAVGDARRELTRRLAYHRRKVEVLRGKLRLAARLTHYETDIYEETRDKQIHLFVGLELSSKTAQLGAFREGWLYRLPGHCNVTDTYSPLAERIEDIARELETHTDFAAAEPRAHASFVALQQHERIYHDVIRGKRGRPWHTYIPRMGLSGEVASLAGVPGLTFTTLNDERHRVDSPADTIDHVNFANLATQTRFLLALFDEMANEPELVGPVRFKGAWGRVKGKLTMELSGRRMPDQPVPDAIALLYRGRWEPLTGARRRLWQVTGPDGEFDYTGIANRPLAYWRWMRVDGYRLDPETGQLNMAINRALLTKYPNSFPNNDVNRNIRPVLFDCEAIALYNLFDQRYFDQLWGLRVLDARRESNPIRFGYDKWWINGVLYVEPLTPFKVIMTYRQRGVRLALLKSSKEHPEGVGYTIAELREQPMVPLLVARDFYHLVDFRLGVLEARGIRNRRLRELHDAAKGFLDEADKHLAARQYDRAIDAARSAWAYESRAYPDVQATIHDTVAGVLFYVALLLPFAYCVERLFFSMARVTARAAVTLGIMAAAIAILWQIHPAFQLSNNPFIVILAFFLLGLGGLTLTIIVARFEDEMRKMERERSGIEVADVSRMSAFGAAFALGISNMRRRKVRTGLTAATLVILTFAIMSFTSTRTRPVEREQALEARPTYKGVLIRRKLWARMSGLVYGTLYDKYREQAIVAPRIWRGPQKKGDQSYIDIRSADGRRKFTVKSLLGLSTDEHRMLSGELLKELAEEEERQKAKVKGQKAKVEEEEVRAAAPEVRELLEVGRWFEQNNASEVLIPRRVAQALGVRDEDVGKAKVQLFGIEFTVAGIFSGETFESFLDLNGEPISPVDWSIDQEAADQEQEAAAEAESETGEDTRELQYIHVPASEMAILPYETLWTLGGSLRSVAVAFDPAKRVKGQGSGLEGEDPLIRALAPDGGDAARATLHAPPSAALRRQSIAHMRRHLKDRLTLTLYFGDEQGVYKFTAADVPSFQGLRNVFVPLIIAFLIVLNTMLGSVHERIREVGIYSSVGLAPGHISMLFIAEALGLATMSAVAGYLISQTVVKVLFTAGLMNTEYMFLNYSSLATVGSLLLVVLMVLASTLYPAHMVSRVASPDIERRWSLPAVAGDQIELRLPYSLNHHDVPGLMLFLYNYIHAHEEISLGVFCVRDVEIQIDSGRILLNFSAWLAPYDLGVYQQVRMTSEPAEDEGHDNISVTIDRESGELSAWKRNNQTFLNQVRKQFLIWRAIGAGGRARHVREAHERFGTPLPPGMAEVSDQQSAVSDQPEEDGEGMEPQMNTDEHR